MKFCSVDDCQRPARSRGLCPTHYSRYQRHGDPLIVRPIWPWPDNLLKRMDPQPNGCVHFTGPLDRDGYGASYNGERRTQAHRASWELHRGPIPDGMHIDHVCHNEDPDCPGGRGCFHRRCVNPDHLAVVTPSENVSAVFARRRSA